MLISSPPSVMLRDWTLMMPRASSTGSAEGVRAHVALPETLQVKISNPPLSLKTKWSVDSFWML